MALSHDVTEMINRLWAEGGDSTGRILLQRRSDSGNWALPGGTMDIGETFAAFVEA